MYSILRVKFTLIIYLLPHFLISKQNAQATFRIQKISYKTVRIFIQFVSFSTYTLFLPNNACIRAVFSKLLFEFSVTDLKTSFSNFSTQSDIGQCNPTEYLRQWFALVFRKQSAKYILTTQFIKWIVIKLLSRC